MDEDWRIVKREPGNVLSILIKSAAVSGGQIICSLPEDAAPGSTAYTATLSFLATKDLDGEWKPIEI